MISNTHFILTSAKVDRNIKALSELGKGFDGTQRELTIVKLEKLLEELKNDRHY